LVAFTPSPAKYYEPANAKIAEFHAAPQKIRALFGGNRSGKSEAGGRETVVRCEAHKNHVAWACGISFDGIGEYVAPKIFKYLTLPGEVAWRDQKRQIPAVIRLKNGSVIYFKSYDQEREKFQGAGVDFIWLDEEPPEEIYTECLARTTDRAGKIIMTMTPLKGLSWVYERIYNADNPIIKSWTISTLENKFLPEDARREIMSLYTTEESKKRIFGQFLKSEGSVWNEFDKNIHIIPRFPIPADWRKIRTIDFGYTNPFCCLWLAMNPDGEIFVYNEHYQTRTILRVHAEIILQKDQEGISRGDNFRGIEATVADHDAQDRAELEEYGIYTLPAKKNIRLGLETVNRAFMLKGNQRSSLYIFNDLPNIIRETKNYSYPKGRNKRNETELPEPFDDHTQDALRYGVMYFAPSSGLMRAETKSQTAFYYQSTGVKRRIQPVPLKQLLAYA
jgi:phage terminase large subunit